MDQIFNFEIDKQTKNDLNIFPKTNGEFSIFDYYNYTSTEGGRNILKHLLDTPKNNKEEINDRSNSIKFLRESNLNLQLDSATIDFIEYYVNLKSHVLKDNSLSSYMTILSNILFKDSNDFYIVSQGLSRLIKHINTLLLYINAIQSIDLCGVLLQLKSELITISSNKEYISFLEIGDAKLSIRQIHHFDNFIRTKEIERIKNILNLTYYLDAYTSVAKSAEINNLTFSKFNDAVKPNIRLKEVYHPLLKKPVLNDFELDGDKQNLCFISGANMAGKSTFLKSVGLCVYLSHVGFPVPVTEMNSSIFNGLFSTINLSDNINKGYSHFYTEVKRIKDSVLMIKNRKKVLIIFDELFRGTNVKDAFEATVMITSGFSKITTSLFFISTHIVEATKELERYERVSFKCFSSRLKEEKPIYDYKLIDGVSSERLGLTIVKNEKIMEMIEQIIQENKS